MHVILLLISKCLHWIMLSSLWLYGLLLGSSPCSWPPFVWTSVLILEPSIYNLINWSCDFSHEIEICTHIPMCPLLKCFRFISSSSLWSRLQIFLSQISRDFHITEVLILTNYVIQWLCTLCTVIYFIHFIFDWILISKGLFWR